MICTNMYNIYDVDQLLIIDVVTLIVVLYLKIIQVPSPSRGQGTVNLPVESHSWFQRFQHQTDATTFTATAKP